MIKIISILVALAVLMTLAGTVSAQDEIFLNNIAMDNFVTTNINAAAAAAAAAPVLGTASSAAAADAAPTVGSQTVNIHDITTSIVPIAELTQGNGVIEQEAEDESDSHDYYHKPHWYMYIYP